MKSLRNLAYTALLAATVFNYAPTPASAEEPARGHFKLAHDVRWENVTVLAGEYSFSYDPNSISPVLTISRIDAPRTSFMLMVPAKDASSGKDSSAIVLESNSSGSYVSALHLPESGVTLHFWAPRSVEKQVAKTVTVASAGQ